MRRAVKLAIGIAIAGQIFWGCAKRPEACFTLPHDNPFKVGETISLDGSCSKNASFYTWFYGDGTFSKVSSEPQISHTFTAANTYQIKLRVEGKNSNDHDINMEVIVEP